MKKVFVLISVILNFIFGFVSLYALLWWVITFYSVHCLINGCSDMVGEEASGIFIGSIIAVTISAMLFPLLVFTNLKLLRVTSIRKKYYLLLIVPFLMIGLLLAYYLRIHHVGPF